jgi:hypothetical protein
VTPEERLLAAVDRLASDVATAVVSHCDLHSCGCDGSGHPLVPSAVLKPSTPGVDPLGTILSDVKDVFAVATHTDCQPADTGTDGQVCVPVPSAAFALPLAGCLATAIVPGHLPGLPSAHVSMPAMVPPQTTQIDVSIDPSLPVGLYSGHVVDQGNTMQRPFLIYLDGLP